MTEESSTGRSLSDRIRYSDRGYTGVQEAIARALVADPARAAEFQFAVLGLHCRRLEDPGEAAAAAASLERGDVLLVISHSGRTRSVVDAARRARAGGASVTAITSSPRSVLARFASLSLGVDAAQTGYVSDEMPFRLAHLAIVQVLATTMAARLHPTHLSARRARWAGGRFDLRYGNDHDPGVQNR